MKISLCLIVKDEEKTLAKCVMSYAGLFDELVIVDTGSSDGTKQIARKLGAAIYDFTWHNDFSAARNFCLSKVKMPWVMMVDADDFIKPEVRDRLHLFLKKISADIDIICLPYLFPTESNSSVVIYKPRLWKTAIGLKYRLPVHEYLELKPGSLKIIRFDAPIVHGRNPKNYKKSLGRNLKILEEEIKRHPDENRLLFYLGHDHHFTGAIDDAIFWYQKFIDSAPKNRDELNRVHFWQGCCYLQKGLKKEAKHCFRKAIKANGNFIEPHIVLGDMAMRDKKNLAAIQYYVMAAQCRMPVTHVFYNPALYKNVVEKRIEHILKNYGTEKQ